MPEQDYLWRVSALMQDLMPARIREISLVPDSKYPIDNTPIEPLPDWPKENPYVMPIPEEQIGG